MLLRGRWLLGAMVLLLATISTGGSVSSIVAADKEGTKTTIGPRNISISGDEFLLDGAPLHVMSGSIHYFRSPAGSWRRLLQLARAAGLNAVSTYVEWSYHEPEERQYAFSGDRDLAAFLRTAQQEGLLVLLRPGPYICAERDLGGLPYWLLSKYPNIRLRTTDQDFLHESEIWLDKLFEVIKPLLYGNGGPIILVQVENEYGSYGSDHEYMAAARGALARRTGAAAVLYTTDGSSPYYYLRGRVADALTTIDFGVGTNVKTAFSRLREHMPRGPLMNSEFYTGWLVHWGEPLPVVTDAAVAKTLKEMLQQRINFNFYMFHGGTNFEFYSGANFDLGKYKPTITSYDYIAPLDEYGRVTSKYTAIKETIEAHLSETMNIPKPRFLKESNNLSEAPTNNSLTYEIQPPVYKVLELLSEEGRALFGKPYQPVRGPQLPTFEQLGQRSGLVLYETNISLATYGLMTLKIESPRDRIYVFINEEPKGVICRMTDILSLPLMIKSNAKLSLLVENQGRINFGSHLHDFKGILSDVLLDSEPLDGEWSITGFPLESVPPLPDVRQAPPAGPAVYEFSLDIPDGITTIRFGNDNKGSLWVNGHNLGRYWNSMAPHVDLFVPGEWKRPGSDRVHALELERAQASSVVTVRVNTL